MNPFAGNWSHPWALSEDSTGIANWQMTGILSSSVLVFEVTFLIRCFGAKPGDCKNLAIIKHEKNEVVATQIVFIFIPNPGVSWSNLTCAYFSNGLVQPPTSSCFEYVRDYNPSHTIHVWYLHIHLVVFYHHLPTIDPNFLVSQQPHLRVVGRKIESLSNFCPPS